MSITIPSSAMGICFMRGQTIRSVGSGLFCATTQISSGKVKDAQLTLGLARMSLETLTQISPPKEAKKAGSLRKRLVETSKLVGAKRESTKAKLAAVKALSWDFQKLERSLSKSCKA